MLEPEQLFIFHIDYRYYAIPLAVVERVIRSVEVTPLPLAIGNLLGVINIAGTVVPVINTRLMLGINERGIGLEDVFVLVSSGQRNLVLIADGIEQVSAIDTERLTSVTTILPEFPHIKGIARLDENLVLIHDLELCLTSTDAAAFDRVVSELDMS